MDYPFSLLFAGAFLLSILCASAASLANGNTKAVVDNLFYCFSPGVVLLSVCARRCWDRWKRWDLGQELTSARHDPVVMESLLKEA
jgi:hypothetical protein